MTQVRKLVTRIAGEARARSGRLLLAGALGAAGAVAGALVGSAAGLGGVAFLAAPVLLYHRVEREGSFDNDTRRRIFEVVRALPGSCIADIADKVGVSHSTASYHLEKLSGFKHITSTLDGNKVRYFVNGGAFSEDERRVLSILDNGETRRVLHVIQAHPWCYRAELTTLLGVSSPTVNWHLERLMAVGLVTEQKQGRSRFLNVDRSRLQGLLNGLVEKLKPTGYDYSGLVTLLTPTVEATAVTG